MSSPTPSNGGAGRARNFHTIVREAKRRDRGWLLLPDGTMVVVENGNRMQGMTVDVVVTSSLQTAAGRMIFGRPKED
jgi:uncharacterized protein YacL